MLLRSVGIELPVRVRERLHNVLIYGAGTTGVQLLEALRRAGTYEPIGFIDMSPTLWGQYVAGLKVYRPERLPALVQHRDVREVLLAMPKASRRERQAALRQLEPLTVNVRTLPAIEDLAAGRVTVSDLRPVEAEDLLGRDPVPPNATLLARNIAGKSVLVTGAGGSIGSELVRQILRQGPRRLVLFDVGEGPLYEIEREAHELLHAKRMASTPASSRSARDRRRSGLDPEQRSRSPHPREQRASRRSTTPPPTSTCRSSSTTRSRACTTTPSAPSSWRRRRKRSASSASCWCRRTRPCGRPASWVPASAWPRWCCRRVPPTAGGKRTVFTMVRFGNVLDSSGSVVRMFRRQIAAGGPVTVTDPEAIRYFMSIPEAAALVIQAGAMATGGDVFVLDMDEPVKIDDLAKSMIRLMGLEVRDATHPDGDIAIEYIGLRHGEKLHEELLLGENITPTEHPRILKSHEPCMPAGELAKVMDALRTAMDAEGRASNPCRTHASRGRLSSGAAPPARGPACQRRQRQGARSDQPHRAPGVSGGRAATD